MIKGKWLLDCPFLSRIVDQFFVFNPHVRRPESILQFWSWEQIGRGEFMWHSEPDEIVFIGGGYARVPIDFGYAIVIMASGSVEAPIKCGYFYHEGGLVQATITERLHVLPEETAE